MVSADTTTYKVTYANAKGRSAGNYRKWSKTVNAGEQVQLPKISRKGYEAKWVTTINGKKYKYSPGQTVTINRNTKFCLNLYKIYTVRYYTANGKKEYKKLRQTVSSGKREAAGRFVECDISVYGLVNEGWRECGIQKW